MTLSRVYVRAQSGKVHVRVRAGTSRKLFSLESCNLDQTADTFLNDLRGVDLDDLCDHCFSSTDAGAVLEASYAAERDPDPDAA